MPSILALVEHLAPDSIWQLERAAQRRFAEAEELRVKKEFWLGALYLYGYTAEMILSSAYFRSAGFPAKLRIDGDTRRRRMARARQLLGPTGKPLMDNDAHPIVGWARFLEWQRLLATPAPLELQRLKQAISSAEQIYRHWRPALRYKTTNVASAQLDEVRRATIWLTENRGRL
jgi:hypothetical protein